MIGRRTRTVLLGCALLLGGVGVLAAANDNGVVEGPAGGGPIKVYANGTLIGSQAKINVVDASGLTWIVTNDTTNHRINLTATISASGGGTQNYDINDTTGTIKKSSGTLTDLNAEKFTLYKNGGSGFGAITSFLTYTLLGNQFAGVTGIAIEHTVIGQNKGTGWYEYDGSGGYGLVLYWTGLPYFSVRYHLSSDSAGVLHRAMAVDANAAHFGVPIRLYTPGASSTTGDVDYPDGLYEGFAPNPAVASNLEWILPPDDQAGCLQSDGAENLSWGACGGGGSSSFVPIVDQFRVSLASTTAAASTDTVGGTVFLVPVLAGQQITLPDGSGGVFTATTSVLSKSLSGLSADSVYDLYIKKDLTLAFSAAWSTWTVRTDALSDGPGFRMVDGGRLIATIRTTAAGTTTRTTGQRYLWNETNRVKAALLSSTTVDTWAYTGAWRQANGDATRRVAVVAGDSTFVDITNNGIVSGNDDWGMIGIGIDRDNGSDANAVTASNGSGAGQPGTIQSRLTTTVGLGFHRFDWIERMRGDNALGTPQFFGHNSLADPPEGTYNCGMVGWWED